MLPGHPSLREDHWEHDREFIPLRAACSARGIELHAVIWDDPALEIGLFDAFIIGTTWDYAEKPDQYLATLDRIANRRILFNPFAVVRWNLRKTYLRDLADKGVPVVPTLWRDHADGRTIARAFDELGVDEIVVKPVVGASAWRQAKLKREDTLPGPDELPPGHTMIQPYLHSAANEGELSFLYFDRQFSHCVRKIPRDGDYRVQSMYGGREEVYHPTKVELENAELVLNAVSHPLLYARVDMMRVSDGSLALMELELIEPYLYPDQGPDVGESFARALEEMMRKQLAR
jgi:glutathione synthase/RimK-type ligase-like ATP-grasp enzyme